ncbi:MAG: cation:proton antiporter [Candidatus Mcinerneyibacterium aminivorans]|uniref:Cation:proton antiporter n=1 Tax=Candidatus Mcinerneyibacterium aminivorans TaxID=2703815 RepID=A0A5D0MII7_9BACT|nr:MAG: cation:proton antiporter [Candidatus Mcinerneyibacterium aminivorans]
MKKFWAIITVLLILFFLGSGLIPDLKIYKQNNLSQKTGKVYLNRTVNDDSPFKEIDKKLYGEANDVENNAANSVTSVIVDYRALDTLGEVTVLFLAITGVIALLGKSKKNNRILFEKPNYILNASSKILLPLIVLFGFYIFIHGHITPGGGFQGGTIVAASVLMMYFAQNNYKLKNNRMKVLESFSGLSFLIFGLLGIFIMGDFLQNFLELGIMGKLFSGGLIPIIYILVGLKVSAELSNVVYEFMGEE